MQNARPISLMSRLLPVSMWAHRQVHRCRTWDKQLAQIQAVTDLSEPYSPPHAHECFYTALFFFFAGGLDQSCLTRKRFHSFQSAWKYVWFKLDLEDSIFSPLWCSLSNIITLFYLFWHWRLLSSSFSLLVQFLQLRCQADKQENYVSAVYANSDWMKKRERKKMLW